MKRYHVAPVLKLNCKLVGLPQARGRVIWALFRKDKFTWDAVERYAACVEVLQKQPLRLRTISSFMENDSDAENEENRSKGQQSRSRCTLVFVLIIKLNLKKVK